MRLTLLLLTVSFAAADGPDTLKRFQTTRIRMGSRFRITLYAETEARAAVAVQAALRRVDELNAILSDYEPTSDLNLLCKVSGSGKPVRVSRELMQVLVHAAKVSRQTDGAFDITVGPLVRLWRTARKTRELPTARSIAAAQSRTGFNLVMLDEATSSVQLMQDGMQLDLGGIAKGYVADEALAAMRSKGVSRALIDAGGDIVVGDPPPDSAGWRIAVSPLRDEKDADVPLLELANASVATSGDRFQFVEINGVRYSHIVDPKTGLGLTTPSSVTVIAPSGLEADSLASAAGVLGPDSGVKLVDTQDNVESLIVTDSADGLRVITSRGFRELLVDP